MNSSSSTGWRNIALAIFAAIIAAFQIGKAIIASPLLQGDPLHLSLGQTGLVISALAIVGAVLAMPLGVLIARRDARAVLVTGLITMAVTSLVGSQAASIGLLLVSRVIEGVAVVGTLICASSIVGREASNKDRDLAMALSSTAVPGGIALVMFAATLAATLGQPLSWPTIWQVNAGLALGYALILCFAMPAMPAMPPAATQPADAGSAEAEKRPGVLDVVRRVAGTSGVRLIAVCFGLYAFIYFAFSGFLPLLLHDLMGLTRTQAGFVGAAIVSANVLGNIGAGALMRRGIASRWIVLGGFLVAAVCIAALFWLQLPPLLAIAMAGTMIGCMGGIPGALTAIAPKVAPSPALIAPTIGFMLQGSYVGQLLGPMSAGALAQSGGWALVAWLLLPLALVGALMSRKL